MEFLESVDKLYYYLFFGIIFLIGRVIVERKDNLKLSLQYYLFSYGIIIFLLAFSLPHVFRGYPNAVALENKKWLLEHLRENNDALAETIQTINHMAFITFAFMTGIIGKVIKYVKIEKTVE